MRWLNFKTINFLEYYIIPFLKRFTQKKKDRFLSDIGIEKNGKNAKRALVIHLETAIPYYVAGRVNDCSIMHNHALIWQVYELVHLLVENGYVIDFRSSYKKNLKVDWSKYDLIIDEANNLMNAPENKNQIKVFYSTGLAYNFHNNAELYRVNAFYERTGILTNPHRYLEPLFSDHFADYILYKGNDEWMKLYSDKPKRHPINTSVTHESDITINEGACDFVWIGSIGAIHKGLDLVVEAFKQLPQYKLHIFGNISGEIKFFPWLQNQMKQYPNIRYHGYADFTTQYFEGVIKTCVGHVFPSCSENGATTVAQTSFWGLIPITTPTTNSRSQHLGYVINSAIDREIISGIVEHVKQINQLPQSEIRAKQQTLIQFSKEHHTKKACSDSMRDFILKIKK
jgi:glycosyltransferase involved in cell wall biosynthesis